MAKIQHEHALRPKYKVQRIIMLDPPGGPIQEVGTPMLSTDPKDIDAPFVLMPRKDPAAYLAMVTYIANCEPKLANELRTWLRLIAHSPRATGTQGQRNESFQMSRILEPGS